MLQYESKIIKSLLGEGDASRSGFNGASNFWYNWTPEFTSLYTINYLHPCSMP